MALTSLPGTTRKFTAGFLTCAALLVGAPAAGAVERFAAPGGSTSDPNCDVDHPCDLHRAAEVVGGAGDIITLLPGEYVVDTPLDPPGDRTIRGAPGQPRPRLFATVDPGVHLATGSVLRHVDVRITGANTTAVSGEQGVTIEDCIVTTTGPQSQSGLFVKGASLVRDTTVITQAKNSNGIDAAEGVIALRNVTVVGRGDRNFGVSAFVTNSQLGGTTLDVVNSIIRTASDPESRDVEVTGRPGKLGVVRLTHSNFTTLEPGANGEIQQGDGNQTGTPLFVDLGTGNLHQLEGSPTIDKGTAATDRLGETDIDGEARIQGAAPDIGADEFTVASPPGPAPQASSGDGTPTPPPPPPPPPTPQVVPARDDTAPGLKLGTIARSLTLDQFKKGVVVELSPSEAAAFELELRGSVGNLSLARTFDVTLVSRSLRLAPGTRKVRLKPRARLLKSRKRSFAVQLQVTAIDSARNRTTVRRTLKIRR